VLFTKPWFVAEFQGEASVKQTAPQKWVNSTHGGKAKISFLRVAAAVLEGSILNSYATSAVS